MRLNKFLAQVTSLSRRSADDAIADGKVSVNKQKAILGATLYPGDKVAFLGDVFDFESIESNKDPLILALNKPVGYVCSRDGQGALTVYNLLPKSYQHLKIAGRLDKDSSGLVLFTDDGSLLNRLTHPSFNKVKTYSITLNKPLKEVDKHAITERGVRIGDPRKSMFRLIKEQGSVSGREWVARLEEGRNRQIRRTFEALGYDVVSLHRTKLDTYELGKLKEKEFILIK